MRVHPTIHQSIIEAIKGKNYVTRVMRDHSEGSGEPHIYGKRGGRPPLLSTTERTIRHGSSLTLPKGCWVARLPTQALPAQGRSVPA